MADRDQEEQDRKQSELDEAREEHLRKVGGGSTEKVSSAEDTQRQLDETVSDYNKK